MPLLIVQCHEVFLSAMYTSKKHSYKSYTWTLYLPAYVSWLAVFPKDVGRKREDVGLLYHLIPYSIEDGRFVDLSDAVMSELQLPFLILYVFALSFLL